jgi:phosphoglycerate dehydrogenase-like enzyme
VPALIIPFGLSASDGGPIARLVDRGLTERMTEYALLHTLALHRRVAETSQAQREKHWQFVLPLPPSRCCIGIFRLRHSWTCLCGCTSEYVGRIRHAVMGVFRQEPWPPEHSFCNHPRIVITPHNSGATDPDTAIGQVSENIRRALSAEPVLNVGDRGLRLG